MFFCFISVLALGSLPVSALRTPVLLKGESTALRFDHAGSYGYICGLHPGMKGTIEVTK